MGGVEVSELRPRRQPFRDDAESPPVCGCGSLWSTSRGMNGLDILRALPEGKMLHVAIRLTQIGDEKNIYASVSDAVKKSTGHACLGPWGRFRSDPGRWPHSVAAERRQQGLVCAQLTHVLLHDRAAARSVSRVDFRRGCRILRLHLTDIFECFRPRTAPP